MDDKQDSRISRLTRFFEKTPARLGLPSSQPSDRLYRRAERISAATFLATNHIPATEQLRSQTREASIRLLQDSLNVRNELRAPSSAQASDLRASARYLISLVRMLAIAGYVSVQNAGVLIEAIDELGAFLASAQQSSLADSVSFSKSDLVDIQSTSIKDVVKDTRNVKDKADMSDTMSPTHSSDVRKQNVLDVLRSSGEVGIADIAASLPEYSTKMIQRDLVELITAGKVKRSGDKRWSRYSVIA